MILVFGKSGQVATDLQRSKDVMALSREDVDLLKLQHCIDTIRNYAPQAVINAAAYTAVDEAEKDEHTATIINGDAPMAMAQGCAELGIPLVHISTDYVFDGTGDTPWHPRHHTAPKNAYGRSKLSGESGIRNSGAIYAILRTSWIVSAHGMNFVKKMLQLSKNNVALNVVADQIGGPTPANDIAMACLNIAKQLIKDPSKAGTYHFSGYPDVSWAEFAVAIFEKAVKPVTVTAVLTENYPTPAVRPFNSRMDCSTTQETFGLTRPDWRIGLRAIFKDLKEIK